MERKVNETMKTFPEPGDMILACDEYDNYMNAEESVAFGLCDEVVEKIF